MSITPASSQYFANVADQWDELRTGYFTEEVRQAAIHKAYLRPEMIVADIGAGTGFMTAGLAPLVKQVYVFDGSPAMLDVARRNLKEFDNLVFQEADGLSLPLPDGSLDAVFANMYLHHCTDPLAAIQEMVRILRPGGRLVLTDLDAHSYEWMKAEMADVWLGFERSQVREWLEQAGLVNTIIDCTGQSCCAEAQSESVIDPEQRQAKISVFVATGTRCIQAQSAVQEHYGAIAESPAASCNCTPSAPTEASASCCSGEAQFISLDAIDTLFMTGYTPAEQSAVPQEAAEISLGCGNPTALAGLQPGEVVLDIGSGGGIDVFLAARKVGPTGKAIGVDMTPAMLERARHNAQKAGLTNVEFRYGHAQSLPVEDASVDVIISNCVINLTEAKGRVFREAYRALRPGGRLEISDMVTDRAFPLALRAKPENWGNCVFGALPEQEYLDLVAQAGFKDVQVKRSPNAGEYEGIKIYSAMVEGKK